MPRFKSAGGQVLPVCGRYQFRVQIGTKSLQHDFYVIPDLNEPLILGIDFIQQHQLWYCPKNRSFAWEGQPNWGTGHLKVCSATTIAPLSVAFIKVAVRTEGGAPPGEGNLCLANVASSEHPLVTGGPYLVTPDNLGQFTIAVKNCAPTELELARNDFIGTLENITGCETRELNPAYIQAVAKRSTKQCTEKLLPAKKQFIEQTVHLNVPEQFREQYLKVILKNHEAVSQNKFDLGRTDTLMHEIALKTQEPIYVKQFKIPDAHRKEVEKHVLEWLKLGVIQPARSRYNSPIFAVMKKDGGVRLVQDFRALNNQSYTDKYSMKDVSECIGEIGRSGSTIFSTIDLTAGFWQMILHPRARPYTAFTVPGMGQFQWVTSPMGLLGCPASFQRLMETVVNGLANVIVYIDDLLVHSATHPEHIAALDQVLQRLVQHNIKINLQKCFFGSKEVSYLGFRLTEQGILPGTDKLKAVKNTPPPANVHEVRQFLGLCNFFRCHVRNFAQITAPLTALTKKECSWKGGPLPPEALTAFQELQTYLCSEPVVDYPRRDRPYALIADASLGDGKKPGGLGAILTQLNPQGEHCVIAYASRKLQKHECNYTPFLLEMQAAIWGMEHFETYLRGRKFTLFTDHRPLEKLGKVHTKTLNRLQEAMNTFDFEIVYKKGSEMPADYLSRNLVSAISWEANELLQAQAADPLIRALKNFLLNKELPHDAKCQALVKLFSNDCFVEDGLIWRRIKRQFEPSRVVLFLPATLVSQALSEAHGELLTGHDGIYKTKERLMQCFYWPGMDADIASHLKSCHKCQLRRRDDRPPPTLLSPLPLPTEPGQRVHADLFGPLKTSDKGKKFILCVTDAFTKYVELVALPNKEAQTVAEAIFDKWICRFGAPLDLVTDQGTEFCAKLSNELFSRLGTAHLTTSSHHPQCNSQAEVANKTIAKYLASFCDDSTLDWELYLAPLMFSYNTSFHRTIKTSPFFLTYGMEPRLPSLPTPDLRRKFYGESSTDDLIRKLLLTRDIARQNSEVASDEAERQFNKKAEPHAFLPEQLVLLDEHSFLAKNQKLAPKWSGPHKILRLKGDCNVELLLRHNNKKLITHVNRLKPYFVQKPAAVTSPDFFPAAKATTPPPPALVQKSSSENFFDQELLPYHIEEAENFPPAPATRTRRASSTSTTSTANDAALVIGPDPSPANLTYAQATRSRSRRSSTSSNSSHHSLPPDSVASRTRSRSRSTTPDLPKLYMPQVSFEPLPVLKEGEGIEESDNLAISIVDGQNSWTIVQKKKKNKNKKNNLSDKWTKQQKENFERFGDIWYQEPYKNYHVSDFATPAVAAQPQAQVQQQPVLQQQPVGQPQPPVLPPQQPIVVPPQLLPAQPLQAAPLQPPQVAPPAIPNIVITPPPQPRTPKVQKRRLEAIPEDDEATGSRRPKVEAEDVSPAQGASGGGLSQEMVHLGRGRRSDSDSDSDEQLRDVFKKLNLTPEHEMFIASPDSSEDDDALPVFKTAPSSPLTPKPAPPSPLGVKAGPPSQRTRQMEKDFVATQLKRLNEAEALEKRKKKELAKEKEAKIKLEKERNKAVYQRLVEAEKRAKKEKKEIKKEK